MTTKHWLEHWLAACCVLGFAWTATPAMAGCDNRDGGCWWRAHHALYHMGDGIALLEANPYVDDAYKGPIIDRLERQSLRLRARFGPRWPHWPSPCCYSRRPLSIR